MSKFPYDMLEGGIKIIKNPTHCESGFSYTSISLI
jgi:hypothetical protein